MKASVEQQLLAVELAKLDQEFNQYSSQAKYHPKREVIVKITDEIEKLESEIIALTAQAGDIKKDSSKLEDEIEQVRARAEKDQSRIDSASNAKEITAMEHEIESLKNRQNDLENQELVLLEQIEGLDKKRNAFEQQKLKFTVELEQATGELKADLNALKLKADQVNQDRQVLAIKIEAELMQKYQKIRSEHQGLAAARLLNSACSGCNISFSPIEVQEIKSNDVELIMLCDNCSCILVRA